MRRASASPAAWAKASSASLSSAALVATTARVVWRVARAVGVVGGGPAVRATARGEVEIEDDGGGHDGHDAGGADGKPAAAFPRPAHHAIRRAEPVGRAAGEEDRVHVADEVARVQRVELACARGAAANRYARAHPTGRREHHRTARRGPRVGPMAYGDAADGGEVESG